MATNCICTTFSDAARQEKGKPENQGCNIRIGYKRHVLFHDDAVIDQWPPQVLTRPKQIFIGFWNVQGFGSKLESFHILSWLLRHNAVVLSGRKTTLPLSVPGFKVIPGASRHANRGGVVVLIRNYLTDRVIAIDTTCEDQVWFKFNFMPDRYCLEGVTLPHRTQCTFQSKVLLLCRVNAWNRLNMLFFSR